MIIAKFTVYNIITILYYYCSGLNNYDIPKLSFCMFSIQQISIQQTEEISGLHFALASVLKSSSSSRRELILMLCIKQDMF
ncbi:MAG: hypothetical protein ACRCVL_00945, partial [Cetobacterium sp.]